LGRQKKHRVNPARVAAARVLLGVEEGAHSDDLLEQLAPVGRDRTLTWHLVLGVLRRQGRIDAALAPHVKRGLGRLDPGVRAVLRLGTFELHHSRTLDHAAVHQAVELARVLRMGRASGLVNAVLRKVSRSEVPSDPYLDLPDWLKKRFADWPEWVGRLGTPSPVCGVWRDADAPVDAVDGGPAQAAGAVVDGTFVVAPGEGSIADRPGFAEGAWWVMDPASVAVADLLHEAVPAHSALLDACAAPGGKALRLATHQHPVLATDLESTRLARVDEAAQRVGVAVSTRVHDWLTGSIPDVKQFDGVLVDAPCSALGIIRRHPEVRWRRLPSDPAAMAIRQRQILRNAAKHVAPGGALVYSVCSPLPEEGAAVATGLDGFTLERSWSTAPPVGDEDGFQAFVLRRA